VKAAKGAVGVIAAAVGAGTSATGLPGARAVLVRRGVVQVRVVQEARAVSADSGRDLAAVPRGIVGAKAAGVVLIVATGAAAGRNEADLQLRRLSCLNLK